MSSMTEFGRINSPVMLAGMSDTAVVRLRDGAELWTAVSGTGPPVVCLHGGPGLWDYLAPLAALLDEEFTVVRFDQRGCGRSTGHGAPFTIEQAVDDLDQVRAALGFSRWAVAGHSWGAELALRYAARHTGRATAVAYIAGVGAGNGFKDAHVAELGRRLGSDRERWAALSAVPAGDRTPAEERERCLLQWRTDFSPTPDAAGRALALWETRPPGASVNAAANRELWNDRETEDLRHAAARVTCPVTMIFGSDDPRPWTASDSLLAALPNASRTMLKDAGHAPWAERPADTRRLIIDALRPALPPDNGTPLTEFGRGVLPGPMAGP
jgi:proline iminopeptidase